MWKFVLAVLSLLTSGLSYAEHKAVRGGGVRLSPLSVCTLNSAACAHPFAMLDNCAKPCTTATTIPVASVVNSSTPILAATSTWAAKQTFSVAPAIPGLPKLTTDVEETGIAGLDNANWFIWRNPNTFDPNSTLRVDRNISKGSGVSGNTYAGLEANCTTNPRNVGYEWCGRFVLYNNAYVGSLPAPPQNVALNATALKQTNNLGPTAATWASNFNCIERTDDNDPVAACIGSEIDVEVFNSKHAPTTDANKQRSILHLAAWTDTPETHIGRALTISAEGGAVVDTPIEVFQGGAESLSLFSVKKNGAATTNSYYLNSSSKPTLSGCGTSPSMDDNSNNSSGKIRFGGGGPKSCTVVFDSGYPRVAFCTITPTSDMGMVHYWISAQSAAGFTISTNAAAESTTFQYTCFGS